MSRFGYIAFSLVLVLVLAIVKVNYFPVVQVSTKADNIVFNAAPKSASEYIAAGISESLGYKQMKISAGYIPSDQVQDKLLDKFFASSKVLAKQHMDASPLNLQYLKRYTDRIVVHVRDPREILLSWVHHLNKVNAGNAPELVYRSTPFPPQGYFALPLSQQIDWSIENYLPGFVKWTDDWIQAVDSEKQNDGLLIMFTTFDQLKDDDEALYASVFEFYEIPKSQYNIYKPNLSAKLNFRSGSQSEWRSVYNERQKRRVAEIVPTELLEYFGWQP